MTTHTNPRPMTMTPARRAVARLMAEGLCTKRIAQRLGRSIATIKTQSADVLWLMRCHNRTQVAAIVAKDPDFDARVIRRPSRSAERLL